MDTYRIEWDEDGCWLYVDTEWGQQTHMLKIEDPEQLYDRVKGAIGPWLRERDEARAEMIVGTPAYREWQKASGAFACDPDESAGVIDMREPILEAARELGLEDAHWETDDPKHPRYHSTHVDLWDARADK